MHYLDTTGKIFKYVESTSEPSTSPLIPDDELEEPEETQDDYLWLILHKAQTQNPTEDPISYQTTSAVPQTSSSDSTPQRSALFRSIPYFIALAAVLLCGFCLICWMFVFAKNKNEQMYKIDKAYVVASESNISNVAVARKEQKQKKMSLEMSPEVDLDNEPDEINRESIEDEEADIETGTNQGPSECVLNDEFVINGDDEIINTAGYTNGGDVDGHNKFLSEGVENINIAEEGL